MSLGDLSDGGTPGHIPNPEVKPVSADGTWRETSRESRSLPRGFSFNIDLFSTIFMVYNHVLTLLRASPLKITMMECEELIDRRIMLVVSSWCVFPRLSW
jgi:hypothetical protein